MITPTMLFGMELQGEVVEIRHLEEHQALEPGQHQGSEERHAVNSFRMPLIYFTTKNLTFNGCLICFLTSNRFS